MRQAACSWLALLVFTLPAPALAAEGTEIASAFEDGNAFDLFLSVDYAFEATRTAIKREWAGDLGVEDGPMPIVKDLVYHQTRHVIVPRASVGVYTGLQLTIYAPYVLSDNRELGFDQRADPCIFDPVPGQPKPNCVKASTSTTMMDGFLPDGTSGPLGYDASDPTAGFPSDSTTVFRGVQRRGFDQIWTGLTWAPMRQKDDDTKPDWVIGAEVGLSIGKIMRFSRDAPGTEDGVSRGVHEVRVFTGLSKRTRYAEPFAFFWWKAPIGLRGQDPNNAEHSLFWDVGYGQESFWPQQEAGTYFGVEAIPWENPPQSQKLSVLLRGKVQAHFEGRNYSPVWELLAYAGDAELYPSSPLLVDLNPTDSRNDLVSNPGVTHVENYLTIGGSAGFRAQVGRRARFTATFDLAHDQRHRLTFTDAGKEGPDADNVVTPGTEEVNPLHRPIVDLPGRRYIADDNLNWQFFVNGTLMF